MTHISMLKTEYLCLQILLYWSISHHLDSRICFMTIVKYGHYSKYVKSLVCKRIGYNIAFEVWYNGDTI